MMQTTFGTRLLRSLSRLIGWFFGTFWALLGASALPNPYDRAGFAIALIIAIIFLVRLWRYRSSAFGAQQQLRMSVYLIAVGAELLGMYMAALWLPRYGEQQRIYSVVGCIVGLHFATRSQRFLHITAGMVMVSLVSMFVPFTWHTVGLRYLLLGAGNAIVLWIATSGPD
jgi:hypothetical protein